MDSSLRKGWFLSVMLMTAYFAFAQATDVKVIKERDRCFITKNVEVLRSNSLLPLDSVLLNEWRRQFRKSKDELMVFEGYNPNYYWFRFSLTNSGTSPKKLILLLGPLGIRDGELFQGGNGKWKSLGKTGNQYQFIDRPYQYIHCTYPVTSAPSSLDTFYLFMDYGHEYKQYSFVLMHEKRFKVLENRVYFMFGILIGLLSLFFFFNIYLFLNMNEGIYAWYSLYILMVILFVMKYDALDEQFLGWDSEKAYRATPMMGFASLGIGILVHVVQLFVSNVTKRNFLVKTTFIVKWVLVLSAVVHFIVFYFQPNLSFEAIVHAWTRFGTIAGIVIIIINCIYGISKSFKPAWFILSGLAVFFFGALKNLFITSYEAYLFPPSIMHYGMGLETIIISFGLIYGYRLERKEKARLNTKLQEQKLLEGEHIIGALKNERERISRDLHHVVINELGILIANIKKLKPNASFSEVQLQGLISLSEKIKTEVREISHKLWLPEVESTSLNDLVLSRMSWLNDNSNIKFIFYYSHNKDLFGKDDKQEIYSIILELTTNVIKHAQATETTVQLLYFEDHLQIMVEDNGKGIPGLNGKGIGLKSVRSRVEYFNGNMQIDSSEKGTTIIIQIPFR